MEKVGVQEIPNKDKGCQELLKTSGLTNGWLRQKTRLHRIGDKLGQKLKQDKIPSFTTFISWDRRFVIIDDGYVYIYNNENARRPERVLDLGAFQSVEKVENLRAKDASWPFKIVSLFPNKDKYFSASSQEDVKNWIKAVQKGLDETEKSGRREKIKKATADAQAEKEAKSRANKKSKKEDEEEDEDGSHASSDYEGPGDGNDSDYDEIPEELTGRILCSNGSVGEVAGGGEGSNAAEGSPLYEIDCFRPEKNAKAQTMPRRDIAVPAPPTTDKKPGIPKTLPKPNPGLKPEVNPKPPVAPKKSLPLPPNGIKKELPPLPQRSRDETENEEVIYETEEYNIVEQAMWRGDADEGTRLMRSIKEDGVYMIRESTSSNGDQTLQVIANGELRKYKIAKEGNQYRLAGGREFSSCMELLQYYNTNAIPNYDTKLVKPYTRAPHH